MPLERPSSSTTTRCRSPVRTKVSTATLRWQPLRTATTVDDITARTGVSRTSTGAGAGSWGGVGAAGPAMSARSLPWVGGDALPSRVLAEIDDEVHRVERHRVVRDPDQGAPARG